MKSEVLANTVLNEAKEKRIYLQPLRLQKLMYFVCGFWAAEKDEWLIDEVFKAYPYGPIELDTYNKTLRYTHLIEDYIGQRTSLNPKETDVFAVVHGVLNMYGRSLDWALAEVTHEKGSPWYEAYYGNRIIVKESMRDYYRTKIKKKKLPSFIN